MNNACVCVCVCSDIIIQQKMSDRKFIMRFDFQWGNLCFNPLPHMILFYKCENCWWYDSEHVICICLKFEINFQFYSVYIARESCANEDKIQPALNFPSHNCSQNQDTQNLSHLIHTPHTLTHIPSILKIETTIFHEISLQSYVHEIRLPRVKCKPHFMERFIKTLLSSNYFHWFFPLFCAFGSFF